MRALSPVLRRAFDPSGDFFAAIPEPGPDDWLAHFPEKGRTFDAFVASAFFGLTVEAREPLRVSALGITAREHPRTGRRQLLTGDVLRALGERLPDDAYCLLGVTMEDLCPDPRFYGEEGRDDRAARILPRSCKVLAHETGHMFGMLHCVHYCCLMNGSNHLAESDSRPLHLCPVCLRKLHHAAGFDVALRYERLLAFARSAGFADEAQWLAGRLAHVRDQSLRSREVSKPSRR